MTTRVLVCQELTKQFRFSGTSLDVEQSLKDKCFLLSSGNQIHAHVEFQVSNSWKKFIIRLCDAGALLCKLNKEVAE